MMMDLLKGKELHWTRIVDDKEMLEVVIYPPQGNITMTVEQYHELKQTVRANALYDYMKIFEEIENNHKRYEKS